MIKTVKKGQIQIYTGDGKGKTTAAIGQAIRALGHGHEVGFVYFHKEPETWNYGEFEVLKNLGVEVKGFAKKHPHFHEEVTHDEMREECLKGVKFIESIFEKENFDLLILDEIIISVRDDYLKEKELLDLLDKKPTETELVLTGREASDKLIEKANLVSQVKKIKHPYDEGMESRPGVEF